MNSKKISLWIAKNIFKIGAVFSYSIMAICGFSLIYISLPVLEGTQTTNLSQTQTTALLIIAYGFIFMLFGEYIYRLLKVAQSHINLWLIENDLDQEQ